MVGCLIVVYRCFIGPSIAPDYPGYQTALEAALMREKLREALEQIEQSNVQAIPTDNNKRLAMTKNQLNEVNLFKRYHVNCF